TPSGATSRTRPRTPGPDGTKAAPAASTSSRLDSEATPIAVSPAAAATCSAIRPTPPPAPSTSTATPAGSSRSEEHTSELQSRFDLVCRRLLEKKKQTTD